MKNSNIFVWFDDVFAMVLFIFHMNPQDSQKVEENVAENVNGTKTSFVFLNFSKSPTR